MCRFRATGRRLVARSRVRSLGLGFVIVALAACGPERPGSESNPPDAHGSNVDAGSSSTSIDAPAATSPDAAQADPCAGVTCDSPPAATCSDSATLVTYSAGTCSAGSCSYSPATQACASGCYAGACVGAGTDACGMCDRVWQCDAGVDAWSSIYDSSGLGCADERTGTTVRCDGTFGNPDEDDYDQGTWSTTSYGFELTFVGINGFPDVEVDCYPD
jgi:hypothetical protein